MLQVWKFPRCILFACGFVCTLGVSAECLAQAAADTSTDEPVAQEPSPPSYEAIGELRADRDGAILLNIGEYVELKTSRPFQRYQVANPELIQAENHSMNRIVLNGKELGETQLHVYLEDGSMHSHSLRIRSNSFEFESIIEQLFPKHELEIVPIRDTAVFLRGQVATEAEAIQIEEIAGEFWPTVHNHIDPKPSPPRPVRSSRTTLPQQTPDGYNQVSIAVSKWHRIPGKNELNEFVSLYGVTVVSRSPEEKPVPKYEPIFHNVKVVRATHTQQGEVELVNLLCTTDQTVAIQKSFKKYPEMVLVSQIVGAEGFPPGLNDDAFGLPTKQIQQGAIFRLDSSVPVPAVTAKPMAKSPTPLSEPTGLPPAKATPPAGTPQAVPQTGFDLFVPNPNQSPGPGVIPPGLNLTPTPEQRTKQLEGEVRELRSDVKKLIRILEERAREKAFDEARVKELKGPEENNEQALLFFHADWCQVCQRMKPVVKGLQDEGMAFIALNIADQQKLVDHYKIDQVPTFLAISMPPAIQATLDATTSDQAIRFIIDTLPNPIEERIGLQNEGDLFRLWKQKPVESEPDSNKEN